MSTYISTVCSVSFELHTLTLFSIVYVSHVDIRQQPKLNINKEVNSHLLHIMNLFTDSDVGGGHRVALHVFGGVGVGGTAGGLF